MCVCVCMLGSNVLWLKDTFSHLLYFMSFRDTKIECDDDKNKCIHITQHPLPFIGWQN